MEDEGPDTAKHSVTHRTVSYSQGTIWPNASSVGAENWPRKKFPVHGQLLITRNVYFKKRHCYKEKW